MDAARAIARDTDIVFRRRTLLCRRPLYGTLHPYTRGPTLLALADPELRQKTA